MKKQILLTTIATIALTGCVSRTQWVPTKYAKLDLEQARNECVYEAEKAAPMMDLSKSAFAQGAAQNDIFTKCMKAKGFRLEQIEPAQKMTQ